MSKYQRWDYWASTLASYGAVWVVTFQIFIRARDGCITLADLGVLIGLGLVTFIAIGWNVHVVLDKYPDVKDLH